MTKPLERSSPHTPASAAHRNHLPSNRNEGDHCQLGALKPEGNAHRGGGKAPESNASAPAAPETAPAEPLRQQEAVAGFSA
jgi:hypothetical protein